jgi:hypothetical protein
VAVHRCRNTVVKARMAVVSGALARFLRRKGKRVRASGEWDGDRMRAEI